VALAMLLGICYGLHRLILKLSPGLVAGWALLATALLPLVGWGGWKLGQLEARGTLAGLQAGLMAAIGAGKEIADVKVRAAHQMRQPDLIHQVTLPVVDVRPRELPAGERVEL